MAAQTLWRIRWIDGAPDSVTTVRTQAASWMDDLDVDEVSAFERSDDDGETWKEIPIG